VSKKLLIAEDHRTIGAAVADHLRREGFDCVWVERGDEALHAAATHRFDAAVLDVMLPGLDGREVLRELRLMNESIPVLMMSARDSVEARVEGLELGADDYLVKPFSLLELGARVHALLRRGASTTTDSTLLRLADLEVDRVQRTAMRGQRSLQLSPREFDLLVLLASNAHRILDKDTLMKSVWRVSARATPIDNLLAVHIARLRKELDAPRACALLHTIRGIGYVLTDKPDFLYTEHARS
jgi:two-component system, OmpR family, copper resistance phosphate regulon response regulator CusR